MCLVLKISRSTYYYEVREKKTNNELTETIIDIFKKSRNNYGARKIRVELKKKNMQVSRRRISRIMKHEGLLSSYTVVNFKPQPTPCNESETANLVEQQFDDKKHLEVVVSDLTYVRVGSRWQYICNLVDLFNREIIGYSAGKRKDAQLVKKAFSTIKANLNSMQVFHTDRGSEFKNALIEETLETFGIKRSLSMKGCPYDNAVAEASFKIIKTEFVKGKIFRDLEELQYELADYVNWFNNHRIHSSLGYLTPKEYRIVTLKKNV